MNQHDQLILLAVLGLVGAFLVLLARQVARGQQMLTQSAVREEVKPVIAEEPVVVKVETPIVPAPVPATALPMEQDLPRPTKKPKSITKTAPKTPIDAVLALLHEKDSLATAFLLREILDPPVSRRR